MELLGSRPIVVVESSSDGEGGVSRLLSGAGFHVLWAATSRQALLMARGEPELVIAVHAGDLDASALCRQLKSDSATTRIPLLLISDQAQSNEIGAEGCAADVVLPESACDGWILSVVRLIREISGTRRAADLGNERFSLVARITNEGIWDWDLERRQAWWNDTYDQLFGKRPPSTSRDTDWWTQRLHPDDRERVLSNIRRTFANGEQRWTDEYRFRRDDGSYVEVLDRGYVLRNAQGKPVRFVGAMQDVTEQREIERSIVRHSEQHVSRLHLLIEISNQVLAQRTMGGLLQRVADGARQLTGASRAAAGHGYREGMFRVEAVSEAAGVPSRKCPGLLASGCALGSALDRHSLIRMSRQQLDEHSSCTGRSAECPPQYGVLAARLTGRDGQPTGAIAVWDKLEGDGAFSREDEALLAQLATTTSLALQQIDALEVAEAASKAKDDFLAVLSHELRTPLTPVLLTASLLERREDLAPEVVADLQAIQRNVQLESRLIDDLLDLTRIARGKINFQFEVTDLHLLVRNAADICGRGDGANIILQLGARNTWVSADPHRLQQVFWNLLSNARKFTPAGGTIVVKSSNPEPGKLRVEVIDSGNGIDPGSIERIFNAFEQAETDAKRRLGGLGLGLTISRAIVEAHRGIIRAHSDGAGRGATFTVELETVHVPLSQREPVEAPRADLQRLLRILLVEDHDSTLLAMKRLITRMGHDVATAEGVEAAKRVAQNEPAFDLVISDLGLPDGSGHELMKWLKQQYSIKGIALSGYGMEDDLRKSREAGFIEHVTKPVDAQRLAQAIAKVAETA